MSEWIDVNDKLPEITDWPQPEVGLKKMGWSKDVLICLDGLAITTGYYRSDGQWFIHDEHEVNRVTHWMPLPELPDETPTQKD